MKFKIQVAIEDEPGEIKIEDIIQLEKRCDPHNAIGLTLSESKQLLKALQNTLFSSERSLALSLYLVCAFIHARARALLPRFSLLKQWLPEHTSPELRYIETKWASLMAYGLTATLLKDVLPVSATTNGATVRNHLHKVAQRQETEMESKPDDLSGCPYEWGNLPKPDKPMTVGIDGGGMNFFAFAPHFFMLSYWHFIHVARFPKRIDSVFDFSVRCVIRRTPLLMVVISFPKRPATIEILNLS